MVTGGRSQDSGKDWMGVEYRAEDKQRAIEKCGMARRAGGPKSVRKHYHVEIQSVPFYHTTLTTDHSQLLHSSHRTWDGSQVKRKIPHCPTVKTDSDAGKPEMHTLHV